VEARYVCPVLTDRARATLRQPLFQVRAPYSFTRSVDGDRPWSPPVPLLHSSERTTTVAFDLACGVRATTPEAAEAIDELRRAVAREDLHCKVRLAAGDLLIVNNRTCAHARSRFQAAFDGTDRWLQRVYVRRSLGEFESSSPQTFHIL